MRICATDGCDQVPEGKRIYCSARCKAKTEERRSAKRRAKAIKLSKARRLAIAGAVAPSLRAGGSKRKIVTVDTEGNPVRTLTAGEVALGLLKRADIELSTEAVAGGTRSCAGCSIPFTTRATNARFCDACKRGRCGICGEPCGCKRRYLQAIKEGRIPRCRACANALRRLPDLNCVGCDKALSHKASLAHRLKGSTPRCRECFVAESRAAQSRTCVECAGEIKGFPRKGKCHRCYSYERAQRVHRACVDCKRTDVLRSHNGLCKQCGDARQAIAAEQSRSRT
jgi:hypothetical protein